MLETIAFTFACSGQPKTCKTLLIFFAASNNVAELDTSLVQVKATKAEVRLTYYQVIIQESELLIIFNEIHYPTNTFHETNSFAVKYFVTLFNIH